jgi:hypothetical protein
MKTNKFVLTMALLTATISWERVATAQHAEATAVQKIQLSAFAGGSADKTGIGVGKNLGITVGADVAFAPYRGMRPTFEVRGTTPSIAKGLVVAQKDILGGLRMDFLLGHPLLPYGDFLFGRGQMNYQGGGVSYNGFNYLVSTSYVYSSGAGVEYNLGDHLVLRVDAQVQRWSNVPTSSGTVESIVGTVGFGYRFGRRSIP